MTAQNSSTAKTKIRYYTETGNTNPAIDLSLLEIHLHALFCQWVKSHFHVRDFASSVEHTASMVYFDYIFSGAPEIVGAQLPQLELPSLNPAVEPHPDLLKGPRVRFYDEDDELDGRIDTDEQRKVLAQFFVWWVSSNFHARDFIQAANDVSLGVIYSYGISRSLGGLGGCKSAEIFLNTRYKA